MRFHIVGFDLSFTRTGWAVVRPGESIRHGVVTSGSVDANRYYPETIKRIRTLVSRLLRRMREGMEDGDVLVVAIEGPSYGSSGGQEHARGGLWWLVYHLIEKEAAAIIVIPPKTAKSYMASNGNADKTEMVAAVQRAFPDRIITDDNEADALTLASMVARELGLPVEVSTQRVRPAALDGVKWPDWITQRRTG